ncbi:MAG: amidohydrolase family protein [Gemmatimonadetes bacterium]|jgi:predicted TIM-barrel fold metal-dependent hydrolase|nr:amidohydrolase family protein [Gemmatimonadota bacterium]MBT6147874.1 amidohydrolase family protein [Gemmatimonadota bacterium]MBT7863533.1 amidohydrolase family protein [Gemmatimonadota bacterium]
MRLCDPHFHLWNVHERPNPNLGGAVEEQQPVYLPADYLGDMARLPEPLQLASSVHVETVVGQAPGGAVIDTVGETRFVCEQMEPTGHPMGIVAYVHLARSAEETGKVLDDHAAAAGGRLRGVRMILNHHPDNPDLTWPQVEHGDFLRDPVFAESLQLMGERGLSFDLQCNPHQLMDAAATFGAHPTTPVIIDHLASFHDGEDDAYADMWREGLRAVAELPHVHLKLSMLFFGAGAYHSDATREAKARDLVLEAIEIFGADRCMFASNYPVDRIQGFDVPTLYGQFLDWTKNLSEVDRAALFHDSAARVYRMV